MHLVQSKAVTVSHREWSEAAAAVSLEYSMGSRRLAYSAASVQPNPSILISAWPGTEQQDSVFTVSCAVVVGTPLIIGFLSGFEDLLLNGWFVAWRDFM